MQLKSLIFLALLGVACSQQVIHDKAGVHFPDSSSSNVTAVNPGYDEWFFSSDDEGFFENSFSVSIPVKYGLNLEMKAAVQFQKN